MIRVSKHKPDFYLFNKVVETSAFNSIVCGDKAYYLSFLSARSAISYALKEIKASIKNNPIKSNIIAVQSYICPDVLEIVRRSDFDCIFVSSESDSLNMDPNNLKSILAEHPSIAAVIVASIYGVPADIAALSDICKAHHVFLINDCAQSLGLIVNERNITSYGDYVVTSFAPGKPVGGVMGGYLASDYPLKKSCDKKYSILVYIRALDVFLRRILSTNIFSFLWRATISIKLFKPLLMRTVEVISSYRYCLPGFLDSYNRRGLTWFVSGGDKYKQDFISNLNKSEFYYVYTSIRPNSRADRLVLIASSYETKQKLITGLDAMSIYSSSGYDTAFSGKNSIPGLIVDIPLNNSLTELALIKDFLEGFGNEAT